MDQAQDWPIQGEGFRLLQQAVFAHEHVTVVDLEATCFETPEEEEQHAHEVIEVGWVLLNVITGEIDARAQIYVKPTTSFVSKFCTKLTGIDPETANAGVSFSEAMGQLADLHAKHDVKVWSSYGGYDRRQLERQCRAE